MLLCTSELDATAIATRVEALVTHRDRQRRRVELARSATPCLSCGAAPTARFLRGQLCTSCAPAQPVGYCAPARCYCPGDSCQRPA